jgi:hypothetical protein
MNRKYEVNDARSPSALALEHPTIRGYASHRGILRKPGRAANEQRSTGDATRVANGVAHATCATMSTLERTLGAGHLGIACAALAWTAAKHHAAQHNGNAGAPAATFQAEVWEIVHDGLIDVVRDELGMPATARALGRMLLALARAFQRDFDLVLRVYGRTEVSTKLDDDDAKLKPITASGDGGASDHAMAYEPLVTDSWSGISGVVDVFIAAVNVRHLVLSGRYRMEDFLCNRGWLAALEHKSKRLLQ